MIEQAPHAPHFPPRYSLDLGRPPSKWGGGGGGRISPYCDLLLAFPFGEDEERLLASSVVPYPRKPVGRGGLDSQNESFIIAASPRPRTNPRRVPRSKGPFLVFDQHSALRGASFILPLFTVLLGPRCWAVLWR